MSSMYPPGQPENGAGTSNANGSSYSAGSDGVYDDIGTSQNLSGAYGAGSTGSASMRDNLSSLKGDLDALMTRVTGMSEEELNAAYERLMTRFNSMGDAARDMASQANEQFNHGVEVTTDYVKEKPLQSVGIAAAVGLVIGMLMSRR